MVIFLNRITNDELFKRIDRNLSGEISLLEMRAGLLDLGLDLGDVVNLLRIFDKNLNGSVERNEFLEVLEGKTPEKMEEKKLGKRVIYFF